jgi:hypothetical protein
VFLGQCPNVEARPPRTCRNCGSEDHIAKECDQPRNPDLVTCRNCEKQGHFSRDCPEPKDWSKVKCSNCGEMGHTIKVRAVLHQKMLMLTSSALQRACCRRRCGRRWRCRWRWWLGCVWRCWCWCVRRRSRGCWRRGLMGRRRRWRLVKGTTEYCCHLTCARGGDDGSKGPKRDGGRRISTKGSRI